eukprot:6154607-Prymnesium_polylepis.1
MGGSCEPSAPGVTAGRPRVSRRLYRQSTIMSLRGHIVRFPESVGGHPDLFSDPGGHPDLF